MASGARALSQVSHLLQHSTAARTATLTSQAVRRFSATTVHRQVDNAAALESIRSNCRKIMCIGRNYADHVSELQNATPKQPFFFLKPPSSLLAANTGPVLRPRGVSLHYEVELGLVLGRTLRDVPDSTPDRALLAAVDAYILGIDMTGRNVQDEAKRKGLPWAIAKGFDTFLPFAGPVPAAAVPDPQAVELWLRVNGQLRQRDSTALMLFGVARQLRDISRVMTLEKGDIVLTGTPKGVGQVTGGDVMEAGMSVDGQEVESARLKVEVVDKEGEYEFRET
nr:putative hydrolase c21c3.09c [Quercus suber]